MSFTPGEGGAGLPNIGAAVGSGIVITDQNGVDFLTCDLVAGPNVAIARSVVDNSITISAVGGGGGVSNVTSTAGSGIVTTTLLPSTIELSSGLVAGTGIQLVAGAPGPTAKNLTINNTQTVSAGVGSGLVITPAGTNSAFSSFLTSGTGIGIVPSTTNNSVQINNTGVQQITPGPGVSINQGTGNVTVSNSGVTQITAGPGIALPTGATGNVTIQNTGVGALTAGTGIAINNTTPSNPVVSNTGVTQVVAGAGISVSGNGTGTVTITNTDPSPATIVAGNGIGVSTAGGNTTITNTGVNAITSPVPGIQIGGTAQNPTITNTGCIQVNVSGPGLTLTGNQPSLPVLQNTGVTSITATAPLVASSPTGGVTLSLNGNIINRATYVNNYGINFTYNPETAYAQVPFTMPSWWNPSNSVMRCSLIFCDKSGTQWPNALGQGIQWTLRYYPGGPFAPSFVWQLNPISKPAGATVLKMTYDYITFPDGTPQPGQNNQIEFNNFSAQTFTGQMTVVYEFIQYSTPLVNGQNIFYDQNWQDNSPGSYIVTEISNAVW